MPHVTVVTRNPAIAVGLTHHGYEVTDVRPDRHGDWARQAAGSSAVVLELSDAVAADAAIRRLRADGNGVQVLVVATQSEGWDEVVRHLGEGVRTVPLPLTLPTLTEAIDAAIGAGPVDVPPPPRTEEELLSAVARQVGLTISDTGTLVSDGTFPPDPAPSAEPEREPDPEPEPVPLPEPAPRDALPAPAGAAGLVIALTAAARELVGVAETAEVVVAELAERVRAEATALLLPEGAEWAVAGGVGLRPLEGRVRLDETHWLVRSVVTDGRGVTVDGTDAARDELSGAPLASWQELLAVPVEGVRGLFVAARADRAFGEDDLAAACDVAAEAAPLLREAMAVRELARALAPYAELTD